MNVRLMMIRRVLEPTNGEGAGDGGAANGGTEDVSLDDSSGGRVPQFEEVDFAELTREVERDQLGEDTGGAAKPPVVVPPAADKPAPAGQPPVTPPAKPAAPVTPPVVPTPPVSPPAVPPVVAPPATPPAAPVVPPTEAVKPPTTPEPPVTFETHRANTLKQLEPLFQFTPDEVEALRVEPEKVLPSLAARVAYESMIMSYRAIADMIPQMIDARTEFSRGVADSNDKFLTAWPELKQFSNDPAKVDQIKAYIKAFKTANPKADLETVIKGAGTLAYISMGIPLPGMPVAPAVVTPPPPPPRPAGAGSQGAPIPRPPAGVVPPDEDDFADIAAAHKAGTLTY